MALTEANIRECGTDDELFKLLSAELRCRLPEVQSLDLDLFLDRARAIPVGLRAMATIYQLDIIITLDDLGWHFANWRHRRYCEETPWALRELEAFESADIFAQAYDLVQPFWDMIGELIARDFQLFVEWYSNSELDKAMLPLTRRMWNLRETDGDLLRSWTK